MNEIKITGEQRGYRLAEQRTRQLLKLIAVKPVHVIVAYAYMLACKDTMEVVK